MFMNNVLAKQMTAPTADDLYELQAGIARALGHPTRLRILDLIGGEEVGFGELARRAGVSKTNLSQHLQVLRAASVVSIRREGRAAFVRLRYPEIEALCGAMRDALARHLQTQGQRAGQLRRQAARRRAGGRP
jgi:DNA-binding transcriptional ArsR family regulator